MRLTKVTLTGVDSQVNPWDLVTLTERFPFVEWGVLFSKDRQGNENRYPHKDWMIGLGKFVRFYREERKVDFPLSAHLCGHYARDAVYNHPDHYDSPDWCHDYGCYLPFDRHQLNLPADILAQIDHDILDESLPGGQIILQSKRPFQYDNLSRTVASANWGHRSGKDRTSDRFSILFDVSGGTGLLPGAWAEADPAIHCGYAGGLNPDNVQDELLKIVAVSPSSEAEFWIDMESGVRTDDWFDLDKVTKVLEIANRFRTYQ